MPQWKNLCYGYRSATYGKCRKHPFRHSIFFNYGGSGPETNQSLAQRIMYGVLPGVLSTPLQLQNGFGGFFWNCPHRVAVFGTGSPAQRRDTSAAGGRVDIAVAQAGGCPVTDLSFTATGTDGSYTGLLEDAAGVYAAFPAVCRKYGNRDFFHNMGRGGQ